MNTIRIYSDDLEIARSLIRHDESVTRNFFYIQCFPLFKSIYDNYYTDCVAVNEFVDEIYLLVLAPSSKTGKCQMENYHGESTLTSWLKTWSIVLFLYVEGSLDCDSKSMPNNNVKMVNNTIEPQSTHIYRYRGFPVDKARFLRKELFKYYPYVFLEKETIELPQKYYYKPRNRYSGNGLLRDLSEYQKGYIIFRLTEEVIYQANDPFPTCGIFGVNSVGTHVSLISSNYPSGKKHADENLKKIMSHELGHSFSLDYCKDELCFMVDAEHKMKFPQTTGFCKSFKSKLNALGWTIK